jgi:hypothetical protein
MFCIALFLCAFSAQCQTKRAFLVGISEYTNLTQPSDDVWSNIHGVNDVDLLSKTLKKQDFYIKRITDKEATAHRIRKELPRFISNCQPGDIVYFHFSCHGQPVEDINGDEDDGWDEALVPVDAQKVYQKGDYTGENHIIDDELNEYLRSIRTKVGVKGFVYVVIDACHAGSSYRGDEEEDSVIIRGTDKGFSKSNKQYAPRIDKRGKIKVEKSVNMANICIIEACRSYQVNSEIRVDGKYYGSLSYYVNKALKSIKLDKSISWTEKVAALMNQDIRLVRQNPVVETSL